MKRLTEYVRALLPRRPMLQTEAGLTAIEYEAICLITYEGGAAISDGPLPLLEHAVGACGFRAAYARAREQAFYCRTRGSEQGFRFWSAVATEVDRRAGARAKSAKQQSR